MHLLDKERLQCDNALLDKERLHSGCDNAFVG